MEHLREAGSQYAGWVDAIPLVVMDMTQSQKKKISLYSMISISIIKH
jgi:hypothetical protein